MIENFTCKVLLTLYKKIPYAMRNNEKKLLKRTRFNYGYKKGVNTLDLLENMIEINKEKVMLANLRYVLNSAIGLMNDENKKFIYYRFVKKLKFVDIAKKLKVSLRQTFRIYNRAVIDFGKQLERINFTQERIEKEFGNLKLYKQTIIRLSDDYGLKSIHNKSN